MLMHIIGSAGDGSVWMNSDFGSAVETGEVDFPCPRPLPGGTPEPMPFTFVGDEAFPLGTHMMRPYAKPRQRRPQEIVASQQVPAIDIEDNGRQDRRQLDISERIFNYRLSRARRVVENAFGILTAKWCILKNSMCCNIENCEVIVFSLICLHNFLLSADLEAIPQNRRYFNNRLVDSEGAQVEILGGVWRQQVPREQLFNRIGRLGGNRPAAACIRQRNILKDFFMSEAGEVPWQFHAAFPNADVYRP